MPAALSIPVPMPPIELPPMPVMALVGTGWPQPLSQPVSWLISGS